MSTTVKTQTSPQSSSQQSNHQQQHQSSSSQTIKCCCDAICRSDTCHCNEERKQITDQLRREYEQQHG